MSEFAKIFQSEEFGQLCCIADTENEQYHPAVRVLFKPKQLGVCAVALIFSDTDEGYDQQESAFNALTLEKAQDIVRKSYGPIVLGGAS